MTTTVFRETDHPRSADGTFAPKLQPEAELELEDRPAPDIAALQPGESQWGWTAVEEVKLSP